MKTTALVTFVCGALLLASPAIAAPAGAPARELAGLEQFLSLSDAQLDELQAALARVRAMSPAERARLKQQIEEFRQLPAERQQALRQGWGQMPADLRDGWREMMHAADDAQRAEIRRQMDAAAPEERTAVRRRLVEEFRRAQAGKK